jgi:predicted SAM-dependent methyltransferase
MGRMQFSRRIVETVGRRVSPGAGDAIGNLLRELKVAFIHRRSLRRFRRDDLVAPFQLNLGCGSRPKRAWINIDLGAEADYRLDVRRAWPFPKNSVDRIYSEHFFEHLEYPHEVNVFLLEARRVLRPGGVLSMAVPDTAEILEAYVSRDEEWFRLTRERWHPSWCDTPLHGVNYHFRQCDQHKYAYDLETLSRVLEQVGFDGIRQRAFDPDLDSEYRRQGSLYVEAFQPDA